MLSEGAAKRPGILSPFLCHLVYTEHLPDLTNACSFCCPNGATYKSTRVLRSGIQCPHVSPVLALQRKDHCRMHRRTAALWLLLPCQILLMCDALHGAAAYNRSLPSGER